MTASALPSMKNVLTCLALILLAPGVGQGAQSAPPAPAAPRGGGGRGPANTNDLFYRLGPDSRPMDGVPKGKFAGPKIASQQRLSRHTAHV